MVDVFEEVEGELRSERYRQLAFKLAPWIIGGLIAGVLAVAAVYGLIGLREKTMGQASQAYADGIASLERGDSEGAFKIFAKVPASAHGYRALALMQQGAIRLETGKPKEAVALFDQAAEAAPKGELGYVISDVARLKSAFAVMDEAKYSDIEARLKPLTEEKRPYRAQAIEALALAKINAGRGKEARQELVLLSLSPDASETVRGNARSLVAMIDSGVLSAMPAVVKAAASLPAAPSLPPELLQSLQQQGAQGAAPPAPGAPQ